MKIDLSAALTAYNGEPMRETTADDAPAATLKAVLAQACLMANEQHCKTGADKYRVYKLLKRIEDGGEQEFEAEEVTELKKLVGAFFPVSVVGPVYEALEG